VPSGASFGGLGVEAWGQSQEANRKIW